MKQGNSPFPRRDDAIFLQGFMSTDFDTLEAEADAELAEAYGIETDSGESAQESQTDIDPPTVEETKQEQAEQTVNDDAPEATVPESRYKDAVREMNRAQQERAELRKQNADLAARLQQLESEFEAQRQSKDSEQESDESLDEARELYPEVVNPLLKQIESLTKQLQAVTGEVQSVKGAAERFQQAEAMTAQERHLAEIRAAHPDAEQLANDERFGAWLQDQAPIIQHAISQGSSKDVIAALDLYRATNPAEAATQKPDKLAAARAASVPSVRSNQKPDAPKKSFTQAEIQAMSRDEFLKHEAAIDDAIARGEIY